MTPLVLCTLTIIVTLAVSGYAKAKEPSSTVTAIVNLKLDQWLPVKPIARVLPWAELALAAVLFFAPGILQVLAAIAALVLFIGYWAVIARAVVQGNTASCNCFGSASTAPVSVYTLVRNTALLLAACGALIGALTARGSALTLLLALDANGWLWLIGAGLASLTLWSIYRSELVPADETEAPSVASTYVPTSQNDEEIADYVPTPIPYASLHKLSEDNPDEVGEEVTLRDMVMSKARVLLWVSPGCGHCHEVISHVEEWQAALPMIGVHPVVASAQAVKSFSFSDDVEVFIDPNFNTERLFGSGTPGAVALGMDMMLAGGPIFGGSQVIAFMEDVVAELTAEFGDSAENDEEVSSSESASTVSK